MVALRHGAHTGFERVAVDFGDVLPPRIQSVTPDAVLGRVRVVLDQPRPTAATAPVRLDVGTGVVTSVFYVVDATETYVDVYTKQAVDPVAFRLGSVAFKDGSVKGIVVIDVVPPSNASAWGGQANVGSGGCSSRRSRARRSTWTATACARPARASSVSSTPPTRRCARSPSCSRAGAPVNGVFRTDVDTAGLAKGDYTLVFTSDDSADDVDGQPPSTTQVVSIG